MHYRTIEPYQQTAGEEFKLLSRHSWPPVYSSEFTIWNAAENTRRFVAGWSDICVMY